MSTSASVSIQLVVEVTVGSWGDGSSFASLKEQATREAKQMMRDVCAKHGGLRIVGEPLSMHVHLQGDLTK